MMLEGFVMLTVGLLIGFVTGLLVRRDPSLPPELPVAPVHGEAAFHPPVRTGQMWQDRKGRVGVVTDARKDIAEMECPEGFSEGKQPYPNAHPDEYHVHPQRLRAFCTLYCDENGARPEVESLDTADAAGDLTLLPEKPLRLVGEGRKREEP